MIEIDHNDDDDDDDDNVTFLCSEDPTVCLYVAGRVSVVCERVAAAWWFSAGATTTIK